MLSKYIYIIYIHNIIFMIHVCTTCRLATVVIIVCCIVVNSIGLFIGVPCPSGFPSWTTSDNVFVSLLTTLLWFLKV